MTLIAETIAWLADPSHWSGTAGIPNRLIEHLGLSAAALSIAIVIALPAGLAIGHTRRGAAFAANLANVGRAIPSLAVIGIAIPFTVLIDPQLGFKIYPTIVAMVILAIPPILVNAEAGVVGVDRDLVEAARAMGLREGQLLARIEIPIALPVILAGIRSGASQIVATMTLGAIFGSGGLGRYLVEGISQRDVGMTAGGVVLVAGLALAVEGVFALVQRRVTARGASGRPPSVTETSRGSATLPA